MNKKDLKSVLAELLLPLGYVEARDMFFRQADDVFLTIHLEKSSFGGNFTVNIGIFVNADRKLKHPPPYHQTHLRQTLFTIAPQVVRNALIPALDLEVPMAAKERATVILDAIRNYALPFLDSLSTIEGIADYLSPARQNFAGVTLALRDIIKSRTGREQAM